MVSSTHAAMHRIFQEDPGMFARAFRVLGIPFTDPVSVALLPTDLTEDRPLERRVDTLLQIDTADKSSYLLVIEAQRAVKPDKRRDWVGYLGHLYAKYDLPPLLLVVCQDKPVADRAGRPIKVGTPEWTSVVVRPLILGPHNVPVLLSVAEAARDIPLAALSAIVHGKSPQAGAILAVLAAALKTTDPDTSLTFAEFTQRGLGCLPAADIWRNLVAVDLSYFQSDLTKPLRDEGRDQGRAQSRAEDILRILDRREIATTPELREQISGCTDLARLDTWFDRALTCVSADELDASDGSAGA